MTKTQYTIQHRSKSACTKSNSVCWVWLEFD